MLKLERMELSGFKSFRDRSEIVFPPGVTAIVGPNGCGKSNIGDAINWVLGEQSARMLRGQQMADVIFNGSEQRKAMGMAEVGLVFSGAEGLAQAESGRVVIARRLYRSGESEYRLNGARARLKDVQDLLREAKVGARTYATIEQGKIDQVLNAKPKERRALIEDAAGISGYKHKRRLAELRLEATQANLLRVQDIVAEVTRQINSLKRQAAKARRYRRLREELREHEQLRFARRLADLNGELARAQAEEGAARAAEAAAGAGVGRLSAEIEEQRQALGSSAEGLRAAAEGVHQLELSIDRQEQHQRSARERSVESRQLIEHKRQEVESLSQRLVELQRALADGQAAVEREAAQVERFAQELASGREALGHTAAEQESLRARVEALRGEQFAAVGRAAEAANRLRSLDEALTRNVAQRERVAAERTGAEDDLSRIAAEAHELAGLFETRRDELTALRERLVVDEHELGLARARQVAESTALAAARENEQSVKARLATLEDVETRFAGADGVRSLLTHGAASGIRTHGVLADYVEATPEVEGAAEGYLHAVLPTVVVEDDADAARAARFLREQGAGRTWLVARSHPAGEPAVGTRANGRDPLPAGIAGDSRILGRLRDRLTLKASANGVVADRIGDAWLVDSLEAALELHRRHPAADYLTPDGDVVYASGIVSSGGRPAFGKGLLAHKRRTAQAREEAVRVARETSELSARVEAASAELARGEAEHAERRRAAGELERSVLELEHRTRLSLGERERGGRRTEVLGEELEVLADEIERQGSQRELLAGEVASTEAAAAACGRALIEATAGLERLETAAREQAARVSEGRIAEAASRQRLESMHEERRRLVATESEWTGRSAAIGLEIGAIEARLRATEQQIVETEAQLARELAERERAVQALAETERQIEDQRAELQRKEAEVRSIATELEAARERSREHELARARAEAAREHLDDLCRQELGVPAEEAARLAGERVSEVDPAALETESQELRRRIEELGPVNLTAIDEFTELEARHGFLAAQREDLERSIESLRETIRRINRQSRERFTEVFEQVRVSYQEVFKLLFSGGRADLKLEEDEDVLECGIEILAQPPGKRLASVQLMSGGEKALSAIALLFAIFRVQPSPFCLLDEVDAALDDSNVGRFAKMVSEYARNTQFLIVTHNKLSMEAANLIYGITMEEPGVSKVVSLQLA